MNKNSKTIFSCQSCGYQTPKWMGRCPDCAKWDTFSEEARFKSPTPNLLLGFSQVKNIPVPINAVEDLNEQRISTGIMEFDRTLGGGLVSGSLVLIGGEPGIGKSTLMLQALGGIARQNKKVLYVSGEESMSQIKIRSKRLSTFSSNIYVVSEINIESIMGMVSNEKPDVLVIDSIQTMLSADITSAPGSVSQVRESTMKLMLMAKQTGIPTFLTGHVTKDGAIAGPKLLEHMVDTVLYFEGDRNHIFRILRTVKNRFGPTNEIGVFEMKENGLNEVANPSAAFLSERPVNAPGSIVTASMEGTRPILIELQALVSGTNFGNPRRTILGLDQNRVALLVAVMEKKAGINLLNFDIFMNVAGGVKVNEPAVDMGIITAVASSFQDKPVPEGILVLGEVGLAGEVRGVSQIETRVAEARKMGFTKCLVPDSNLKRVKAMKGIEISGIKNVMEGIEYFF